MTERVVTYIDGFNLYFGLKNSGWRRYYWLDVCQLAQNLLKSDQELVAVRYFTSRISNPPEKQKRQATYLEALTALPAITIIYGKYQINNHYCPSCGALEKIPNEKRPMSTSPLNCLATPMLIGLTLRFLSLPTAILLAPFPEFKRCFPVNGWCWRSLLVEARKN